MRNGSLSERIESLLGLVLFAMRVAPSWSERSGSFSLANAASSTRRCQRPNDSPRFMDRWPLRSTLKLRFASLLSVQLSSPTVASPARLGPLPLGAWSSPDWAFYVSQHCLLLSRRKAACYCSLSTFRARVCSALDSRSPLPSSPIHVVWRLLELPNCALQAPFLRAG